MELRTLTEFEAVRPSEALDTDPKWQKALPLALAANASTEEALVEAIRNGLDHLAANEACVLERAHEEGVHQMRVAVRRLRSRVSVYENILPAGVRAPLEASLKWLVGRLGPARDWDVFLSEVLPRATTRFVDEPNLMDLKHAAEERRDRGYERAHRALASERYAELKALLGTWIDDAPWRTPELSSDAHSALSASARDLAEHVLGERHRQALEHGSDLDALDDEERHRLRIQIKKVRYATEFFGPLFEEKSVNAYLRALKGLQDRLGLANDVVVARSLMWKLVARAVKADQPRFAFAAGLVVASQPETVEPGADLATLWNAFRSATPFWS